MQLLDIDKIAPDPSQKVLGSLMISSWVLSFMYYTPEKTAELLWSVGLQNISPAYDSPTIIPILLFIWITVGIIDATYIHLRVISDIAISEGLDTCESCVGGKLHIAGDWGWLRVGGTKAVPIEGGTVLIGLLTHIHKIGTHVVFEGSATPKTILDYVPFELKNAIRQRRGGLFGLENCSIGYLSTKETMNHKEFETANYSEFFLEGEKTKIPKNMNTSEFINEINIKNKAVDMSLQLIEGEHESLTKSLRTIKDVGAAINPDKPKGIWQHIFG